MVSILFLPTIFTSCKALGPPVPSIRTLNSSASLSSRNYKASTAAPWFPLQSFNPLNDIWKYVKAQPLPYVLSLWLVLGQSLSKSLSKDITLPELSFYAPSRKFNVVSSFFFTIPRGIQVDKIPSLLRYESEDKSNSASQEKEERQVSMLPRSLSCEVLISDLC